MKKIVVFLIMSMLLTSCVTEKTVATVGNSKIKSGEFEFYLSSIKEQLSGTELKTEEDWQTQEIEGKKAIEVAKERAMDIAVENAEFVEVAKKIGLLLTDDDKESIKETKKQIIESYGGETKYKEFLKSKKISDRFIQFMCESPVYYQKIKDKLRSEESLSEDDCFSYYKTNKDTLDSEYRKAKHILFLTTDMSSGTEYSKEKQAEVKALADEVYERVLNGEDFDTLMNEYTEDPGTDENPDGYVFESGEMVAEFEQATDSIGFDEITMCKSSFGYHIIKRLPIEYDDIADRVTEKVWDDMVSKKVKQWEKEYNIAVKINNDVLKEIN